MRLIGTGPWLAGCQSACRVNTGQYARRGPELTFRQDQQRAVVQYVLPDGAAILMTIHLACCKRKCDTAHELVTDDLPLCCSASALLKGTEEDTCHE